MDVVSTYCAQLDPYGLPQGLDRAGEWGVVGCQLAVASWEARGRRAGDERVLTMLDRIPEDAGHPSSSILSLALPLSLSHSSELRHPDGTIEADRLPVQKAVLDDVARQPCKLLRVSIPRRCTIAIISNPFSVEDSFTDQG